MARSFSNVKQISAFVSQNISIALTRRGYAAASQGVASGNRKGGAAMLKKGGEESSKSSWVPDPVTGYYRPENQAKEVDAAKLRDMFLNHKN